MSQKSLGEQSYEQFAKRYADAAITKRHNALLERPATFSLVPDDLNGQRALDVASGPGITTEMLLDRGAEVVGFDVTPDMVKIGQERVGDRAHIHLANLEEPLTFAEDESFDLVLAALCLDYIADWHIPFSEFNRVLKPGGTLIYSIGHPHAEWVNLDKVSYFETEYQEMEWGGYGDPKPVIKSYRRPLNAILMPHITHGFRLDHILEPQPLPEFAEHDAAEYERLMRAPLFICIRAVKI